MLDAQGEQIIQHAISYELPEVVPWVGKYDMPPDFVLSPWTPLYRNAEGIIHCWNRRYVFSESVLPPGDSGRR